MNKPLYLTKTNSLEDILGTYNRITGEEVFCQPIGVYSNRLCYLFYYSGEYNDETYNVVIGFGSKCYGGIKIHKVGDNPITRFFLKRNSQISSDSWGYFSRQEAEKDIERKVW